MSTTESSSQCAQSTSQSMSNSLPQLPQESLLMTIPSVSPSESISSTSKWDSDIFNDDSSSTVPLETSLSTSAVHQSSPVAIAKQNLLSPPPDKSAVRKMKESSKEQDALYKVIGDTNDVIKMTMNRLSNTCSKPKSDEEEEVIAKAVSYALKRVDMMYRMQCYIECLTVIQKYQNMTTAVSTNL